VTGKVDNTWTLAGFIAAPTNDRVVSYNQAGLKQRLYRTSGTSGAFQLVAERTAAATDWADTVLDANMLGDDLITNGWVPPPVGLKGLISLPNGALAGFYNNQLCFSEPYQPQAWPLSYTFETDSPIVGIAAYGTTVVVCTKTRPYVADGLTPDAVTMQSVTDVWPCLSKRSVCSVGDGVVFSTSHGLAYVGMSGVTITTRDLFSPDVWEGMGPSSTVCRSANGQLYILYSPVGGVQTELLRIDSLERGVAVTLEADANMLYIDPMSSGVFFVKKEVYQLDALYGSRAPYVWRSKEIEFQRPCNLGAGLIEWVGTMSPTELAAAYALQAAQIASNQVIINSGVSVGALNQANFNVDPINGAFGVAPIPSPAADLVYTLLDKDTQPIVSVNVEPGKMFRLPAGYKTDVVTHQLQGNVQVRYLKMAETPTDLRSL